jgi:hypothetical protein
MAAKRIGGTSSHSGVLIKNMHIVTRKGVARKVNASSILTEKQVSNNSPTNL